MKNFLLKISTPLIAIGLLVGCSAPAQNNNNNNGDGSRKIGLVKFKTPLQDKWKDSTTDAKKLTKFSYTEGSSQLLKVTMSISGEDNAQTWDQFAQNSTLDQFKKEYPRASIFRYYTQKKERPVFVIRLSKTENDIIDRREKIAVKLNDKRMLLIDYYDQGSSHAAFEDGELRDIIESMEYIG